MKEETNIVEKVYPLFQQNGAKMVTMNDVSKACGISKKTLYEYFPNKESLLRAVVELTHEKILTVLKFVESQNYSAIEESLMILDKIYTALQSNDDVFMYQLYRYYPQIHEQCDEFITDTIYNHIRKNIEKGISEELFRNDLDIDLTARLLLSNILNVKTSDIFEETGKSRKELTYFILEFYLNSITTPHGKKLFQEIKSNHV